MIWEPLNFDLDLKYNRPSTKRGKTFLRKNTESITDDDNIMKPFHSFFSRTNSMSVYTYLLVLQNIISYYSLNSP